MATISLHPHADNTNSKESGHAKINFKVVAVVVTYNRFSLLRECISKLRNQSLRPREILVVDNGSSDGTAEWLQDQKDLLVFRQENRGGAGGFERGIYEAVSLGAEWVWCMDDDTIPERDALLELHRAELLAPDAGCFASLVTWTDGNTHRMNAPEVDLESVDSSLVQAGVLPINRASFVSICVSARAVHECGLPIGDMFVWFDDVEFTSRIARKFPCYLVTRSLALHKTANNKGVPNFGEVNRLNYQRLTLAYRNHVVYRRQGGTSLLRILPFSLQSAAKISLLYLRFGPDWRRIPWIFRGLFVRQKVFTLESYRRRMQKNQRDATRNAT